jgi:hypothetical protein
MIKKNFKVNFVELFDEKSSISEQKESLEKVLRETPHEEKKKIISYLESGKTLLFVPKLYKDCMDETKYIKGASIITDGTWFWKSYVNYYLRNYNVDLPKNFLNHMSKNNWKIPKISNTTENLLCKKIINYLNLRKE